MAKNTDVIDFQSLVASFSLCGEKLETKFDNINDIEYIVGTQTASTGAWTGKTKSTALYTGKIIIYKLPYAGSGNATLNLTFPNGSKSGAKNVYRYGSTRLTTQYSANYYIPLVFNGTYWFAFADYDTNYYDRTRIPNPIATASGDIQAVCFVGTSDGTNYKQLSANQEFDIRYPFFYNSTAVVDAASMSTGLYLIIGSINLQTLTGDTERTFNIKVPIYIKGTLNGNIFTVHSDIISEAPVEEDAYTYFRVGATYSNYQAHISLFDNRLWCYKNGIFQPINTLSLQSIQDSSGQQIDSTYIKNISANNNILTITKGNNSTLEVNLSSEEETVATLSQVIEAFDTGWDSTSSLPSESAVDYELSKIYNLDDGINSVLSDIVENNGLDPQLTLSNPSEYYINRPNYPPNVSTVTVSYLGEGTITTSVDNGEIITITYDSNTKIITVTRDGGIGGYTITVSVQLSASGKYAAAVQTFQIYLVQNMEPEPTPDVPVPKT